MKKFNLKNKILILTLLLGSFGLWLPVFVLADSQSLSVNLEAIPSVACASLNNVSLKATIFGITSDYATYFFDCTNDGIWERIETNYYNSCYVYKICDYPSPGTYTAKVKVEKQGFTAENTAQIRVYFCGSQPSTFSYSSYPFLSPTIDLKANGSDGPISVAYGSSATLTWISSSADSCQASGDWSGSKTTSGSQIFYNLTSSKTFILTCAGVAGSVSDNVTVNIGSPSLSVSLSPSPSSGCVPLNGVDLTGSVSGNFGGDITYFFDCTNDGTWEKIITTNSHSYTAYDVCNFVSTGNYTAKVKIETQGVSAENTANINVLSCQSPVSVDLKINGYDSSVTLPYNSIATLTWTSNNVNYCTASGDWSGTKSTNGSQTTGSLSSSKIYTITCTGSGGSVSDWVTVNVGSQVSTDFLINKTVRNLSKGTAFSELIYADPREVLIFGIVVRAGNDPLYNVVVKDFLPSGITYIGDLRVDNILTSGDILTGLNVGSLSAGQEKTITFRADVAGAESFSFGQTQLTNTASVSSGSISYSDTAKIIVTRGAVAGAATDVSTGLTNNIFLDSFFLPLMITLLIILLFKSHIIKFEEWLDLRKKEYQIYKSKKILQLKILKIKTKEFFQKII